MDIALLSESTLRIKGKKSTFIIDPVASISKTEAQGIIYTRKSDSLSGVKVENSRMTIKAPGEYEVGGIKVVASKVDGNIVVLLDVDDVKLLIGNGSDIKEIHEKIGAFHIAVINTEKEFNYSSLTSLDPNVLIIYGKMKKEVKKSLGKTDAVTTSKYSVTFEKLPSEMQMILLDK